MSVGKVFQVQVDSERKDMGWSYMFKENIIDHPFWTIIQMPIYKEYLNHTLGLTLSTPGLVIIILNNYFTQSLFNH